MWATPRGRVEEKFVQRSSDNHILTHLIINDSHHAWLNSHSTNDELTNSHMCDAHHPSFLYRSRMRHSF